MNQAVRNVSAYAAPAAPRRVPHMLRGFAWAIAIAIAAMSCTPIAGQPAETTVTSTAAATFSVPATFAVACGTMSDGVQITRASATFVLNSPGRPPLKIDWNGPAPVDMMVPAGGAQSSYACLLLDPGVPLPVFAGLIAQGMPGYVVQGTVPATSANPSPTGFVLPQACAYVAPPVVGTDYTKWAVDCGAQANHDARGTLGPALTEQGWASCAIGLGTMQVKKNGVMLGVQESTLAPGEYPGLSQFARLLPPC